MEKSCYCPTAFNITTGIFLIGLAIIAWLKLWDVYMPFWLSSLSLIIGILIIILNTLNRVHVKCDEHLTAEQADKLHADEIF